MKANISWMGLPCWEEGKTPTVLLVFFKPELPFKKRGGGGGTGSGGGWGAGKGAGEGDECIQWG